MEPQSVFLITCVLGLLSGVEYVASIKNECIVLLFLVIPNFLNAASCPCHCAVFVTYKLFRKNFHLFDVA